jgi:chromosome segregation ATPase
MSEELNETQETPNANDAPTGDELETIRAQIQAEQDALAEAQAALTEKDEQISQLQEEIGSLQANLESTQENLLTLNGAAAEATQKYLETVRVLNAGIPADLIDGTTIAEIDDSVERAQAITDAVRASLEAEVKSARVPAGAPTRAVNVDGLDAREKITLGLSQQKGGTS